MEREQRPAEEQGISRHESCPEERLEIDEGQQHQARDQHTVKRGRLGRCGRPFDEQDARR